MADKTSADKRHDFTLLVVGFALTTVVGGFLTFFFHWVENRQQNAVADRTRTQQAEEARRTQEVNLSEQRREQASKVFAEISELLDTRLYKWRQVAWAIEDRESDAEILRRYADYRTTLYVWNYQLNKNRALVCRYFGPAVGSQYEQKVLPELTKLQERIIVLVRTPRSKRPRFRSQDLAGLANDVNVEIYVFNNRLAEAIRSGNVGLTDPGNACDFLREPAPNR